MITYATKVYTCSLLYHALMHAACRCARTPLSQNVQKTHTHIREMYKTEFRDGPSRCNLRCASWLAPHCIFAHLLQCTYVQRAHKLRVVKQRRDRSMYTPINKQVSSHFDWRHKYISSWNGAYCGVQN